MKLGEYVPKKFRHLMKVMGVKIPVQLLTTKKKSTLAALLTEQDEHLYTKHSYHSISVPNGFVPFEKSTDEDTKKRVLRWAEDRCVDYNDIYIAESGEYIGLFAIAMYHGSRLIGFHIVTKNKYVSMFDGNTNVLYMPERYVKDIAIVVEGTVDARSLPFAVGCLGDHVTKEQAYFLKGKRVIMLPDRTGRCKFVEQFAKYGWEISIPQWDCKDLNDAVIKYGKVAAMQMIVDNITSDPVKGRLMYDLWAKKE
tara:strand:- start:3651 stop:4409 length:759 start_codon:yes stop_codon:yes gene_type:complete